MLFRKQNDGRFIYIYPWQGATLVGTTDLDHHQDLACEPRITGGELDYLLRSVADAFPHTRLGPEDVLSTYAGIRPVISDGKSNPSKATREHAVWREEGLCTVTGGQLTTFRQIALDTLRKLRSDLPEIPRLSQKTPIFAPPPIELGRQIAEATGAASTPKRSLRLLGRYGADVTALLDAAATGEMTEIPGTDTLWAELRFAARNEAVVHLSDLLLRRSRVGLLLARGGEAILPQVQSICAHELGWDSSRWESEARAYTELWRSCYSLPDGSSPQ